MNRKSAYRAAFATLSIAIALALVTQMVLAGAAPNAVYERRADAPSGSQDAVVGERGGITVVTTQNGDMRSVSGELIAFNPNGTVRYHTDAHSTYWDVDPALTGSASVTYVATERLNASVCASGPLSDPGVNCRRNVVERLNLSTGEVTRLYSHRAENGRWHDVDVIDDSHVLVADIGADAVFVVNTTSGVREWTWTVESDLPVESGGAYDADWSHINDVEYLEDGRVMVDLRNQDRVAFLNGSGLMENWTLGSEDEYGVLREQHNPDYIPASEGGPAVVVADSENDRLVEYQRENGSWHRSWTWRDDRMQWPRDADRLPNGNTLVTDTVGDRVFELDESGDVVWSVPVDRAYEAERLGTGDESAGGPSAERAGIASHAVETDERGVVGNVEAGIRNLVPPVVENGLLGYFFPWWMGFWDVLAVFALAGVLLAWAAVELRWVGPSVTVQFPVEVENASVVWSLLLLLALAGVAYVLDTVSGLL
ncbi:arylsulfotransferase family protein [Halomicrococcus sp. SG-WS-1]|uniref:arylsulfotransferase family protein n=1 Tax=Halomicrococcus sp. SG-WS-1 TaxID=3439057 RepID=UPI003F78EA3C